MSVDKYDIRLQCVLILVSWQCLSLEHFTLFDVSFCLSLVLNVLVRLMSWHLCLGKCLCLGKSLHSNTDFGRFFFTYEKSERPQFGTPAERCAQLRVPNVPRSHISKGSVSKLWWLVLAVTQTSMSHSSSVFDHSEFMNTPTVEFLNVHLCSTPVSYLAGSKWGRLLCYDWWLQRARAACGGRIALDGGVASILALWR